MLQFYSLINNNSDQLIEKKFIIENNFNKKNNFKRLNKFILVKHNE